MGRFTSVSFLLMAQMFSLFTLGDKRQAETEGALEKGWAVRNPLLFINLGEIFSDCCVALFLWWCTSAEAAAKGHVPTGSHPPSWVMPKAGAFVTASLLSL